MVPGQEVPVERGEGAGVLAHPGLAVVTAVPAVVAHAVDVGASGGVGLGGHAPTIGVLAHADDVGQHHPLGAVHEPGPHPFGERPGFDAGEQGEVAEDHQALDVVGPPVIVHRGQGRGHAGHVRGCAGVDGRQRTVGPEGVLVPVAGHPLPVPTPHVLPPADDLAHEALDRGDRHPALPVGDLGGVGHLAGVEEPEVEVRAEQGVGHRPARRQHGVLVGAEPGEDDVDGVVEAAQGLGPGGRPGAVGRSTPAGVGEVGQDGPVHVVERGAEDLGPGPPVGGGSLAVLVVEVPLPAGGLVTVHQEAEAPALPAVEVLHLDGPVAGPGGELLGVAEELVRADQLDVEALQQGPAVPGGGLHGPDLLGPVLGHMVPEAGGQRRGPPVVDGEALVDQFGGEPAHGGDDEVGPLDVPALGRQLGVALHQQDPGRGRVGVGQRPQPAVQLVPEHPHRLHARSSYPVATVRRPRPRRDPHPSRSGYEICAPSAISRHQNER